MIVRWKLMAAGAAAAALLACSQPASNGASGEEAGGAAPAGATAPATVEDARAFVERVETELDDFLEYSARVYWMYENFINYDTEWLAERVGAEGTKRAVRYANEAKRFNDLDLTAEPDLARKIALIKLGLTLPAPETEGAAEELSKLNTRLSSTYSTGTVELDGEEVPLVDLEERMGTVRDPALLQEMWVKWREISPPMKDDYARVVEIANDGAVELGYANVGELWLSKYDMPPAAMAAEVDRLWDQVSPLYKQLHCYVRAELNKTYGDAVVPLDQPIRADLLGNMWAQQWANIYDLVEPEGADVGYDLTELLNEEGYTPKKIVETGDRFFQSLGFAPLPDSFWERSLIAKPADREVVCHASAWDLDNRDDIRIKMCTKVNADDFQTVHHELGHNIYQRAYKDLSILYRDGANDGFHEAIGDFVALSITPDYLVQIGVLDESQIPPASADLGLLMNQALDKIAFLPFGLLMDKWRWRVFSGETTPETYNADWWALRTQYQGIRPPVERGADAFDPGAKYHIPNHVPYLRYFLSFVLQFQFHQAACEMAGWEGPLHRCSIYGNEEVGEKFAAMLEAGASEPWPDTLEKFTGTREIDGSAIIAYFQPLMTYLEEENAERDCGW